MRLIRWLLIAGLWATSGQAVASEPCWQLISPLARLACYDRRPEGQAVLRAGTLKSRKGQRLQSRRHGSCLKMSMASRCVGPLPGPPC